MSGHILKKRSKTFRLGLKEFVAVEPDRVVVGHVGEQGGASPPAPPPPPPHRLFPSDGCRNCGLMKEKLANSAWSMLAMTSSSGGVSWGWVRVKNLSKFSAALPHWKKRETGKGLVGCWRMQTRRWLMRRAGRGQRNKSKGLGSDHPRCGGRLNLIWATTRCALTAPGCVSCPSSTCPPSPAAGPHTHT